MEKAICVHFRGIKDDQLECALGHAASIETFYCFRSCPDYTPGEKVGGSNDRSELEDLLSRGGEWSIEEISRIIDAKKQKSKRDEI